MRLLLLFLPFFVKVRSHFDGADCGTEKSCVYVPTGCQTNNVCKQIFSYSAKDDGYVDMELYSTDNTPGTNYLAVGFSKDDLMGDEPVTHCVFPENGKPEVHASFNFGKSNQPTQEQEDKEAESSHVKLIHAHKDDESMYCHFRRKISGADTQYFPSLDQENVILLARGKSKKPELLGIHSLDPSSADFPYISPDRHNIGKRLVMLSEDKPGMQNETTDAPPPSPPLPSESWLSRNTRLWFIRFHGIIMLFAWLFMVTLAVASARYFRDHWPGSAPYGLKWWFHLHRTFNFSATLLILVSTFLIFLAKDFTWQGPVAGNPSEANWSAGSVHSLIGTIAVLTAIINPLMALIRCAPDTGARPIFNWTHKIIGILGIICAMIAIFIATNSFSSLWSDSLWAFSIFLFFIVLLVLCVTLFEVLACLKVRPRDKIHSMELRGKYDDSGRVITSVNVLQPRPMFATTILWILFGLLSFGVAAVLAAMLIV